MKEIKDFENGIIVVNEKKFSLRIVMNF